MNFPDRVHGHDAPEVGDDLILQKFASPRGHAASILVRSGTNDHNTAYSCLNEDEYGLASIELGDGVALDIGAYTGGVTIALALDNKQARVIAVEALSENVRLLEQNVALNGVADRVTVIHGAATTPGKKTATVRWNFDETESGRHHRYVGNAHNQTGQTGDSEKVGGWSLNDLPEDIAFCKIDCELCEYDVLQSPNVKRIAEIRGEFHAGFDRIVELLDATHVVTQTSGTEAFGGFKAIRR